MLRVFLLIVMIFAVVACGTRRRAEGGRSGIESPVRETERQGGDEGGGDTTREDPVEIGLPLYSVCGADGMCDVMADACYQLSVDHGSHVATDGLCTLGCTHERDCPFGFASEPPACLALTGEALCYQRCVADGACPLGFACMGAAPDTSVCLPI